MSENTKIEWCDHTFNPWEGCQKVGPGCDHCYAETRNARFAGGTAINWGPGAPRRRTSASNWELPKRWDAQADAFMAQHGRRQRVFCASLADVFDNAVDPQWRADLFALIRECENLDWLLLTKRIANTTRMLPWVGEAEQWPHVWIGATIVNQAEADRDIRKLLDVPARVRFLSMEPLLGPVDLGAWIEPWNECGNCGASFDFEAGRPDECPECGKTGCMCTGFGSVLRRDFDEADGRIEVPELPTINWVIVGGESGRNARPMHPDWARSLRDQCEAAGVPFLFKQWGEWTYHAVDPESYASHLCCIDRLGRECALSRGENARASGDGWWFLPPHPGRGTWGPDGIPSGVVEIRHVGKKAAGRLLDGRTWDGFPS